MSKLGPSKSRVDRAGKALSHFSGEVDEEILVLDEVFDAYREAHLEPLTHLTSTLQSSLRNFGKQYYIAQRLKRKPQILRKLRRLSVRLTQLQDIGGLRIIAETNEDVSEIAKLVDSAVEESQIFASGRNVDYRPFGRDDSGYRALHKIVHADKLALEVQIRSRAQHYWAESVERTSVFYGLRLKEGEGDESVRGYFHELSNLLRDVESGARVSSEKRRKLEISRADAETVIRRDGHSHLMDSQVNESVIKTMLRVEEAHPNGFQNWILVFDWSTASFVTWDIADRDPQQAVSQYKRYESEYPETKRFEVVLVGASDIATVRKTHSHYFGLSNPDTLLETLGQSLENLVDDDDVDHGAKRILSVLHKRKIWGMKNGVQYSTLRRHFCKDVKHFDQSMQVLHEADLVSDKGGAGVTLNTKKAKEIEGLI